MGDHRDYEGRMNRKMKLGNNSGETLVESLISLLVVSLTIAFLSVAASTASKLNVRIRNTDLSFRYNKETEKTVSITVSGTGGRSATEEITVYESNGYLYYDGGGDYAKASE